MIDVIEKRGGKREGAGAKRQHAGPAVFVTLIVDEPTRKILAPFAERRSASAYVRDAVEELLAELAVPKEDREEIKITKIARRRSDLKILIPEALLKRANRWHGARKPFRSLSEIVRTAVARAAA